MVRGILTTATVLVVVLGAVVGVASAVSIPTFDQEVILSEHDVTGNEQYSIADRTAVYNGTAVEGYDISIKNDGSTDIEVNVTAKLKDLDGNVLETVSTTTLVVTSAEVTLTFGSPWAPGEFAWVYVSAKKV